MSFTRLLRRAALALALTAIGTAAAAVPAMAATTVFAAASLRNALDQVATLYKQKTGKDVAISYAGTSTLAKQIEAGAPADIFFSANMNWMDYVEKRGLIQKDTRRTLLGNKIVLVEPKDSTATIAIAPNMNLSGFLGPDGHLAMANTDSVPAGIYGKAALKTLGVWDSVEPRVVQSDNVRAALAFVARGEVPAGIVYATDAAAEPAVKVVDAFPDDTHPPILYPLAMLTDSKDPDARAFFDFMQSSAARLAYEKQGFSFVAPGS